MATAIRTQLLAVAEERDLPITTADVAAITNAVLVTAFGVSAQTAPVTLTNQQTGVLVGMALGETAPDTARRMCVSLYTVRTHRRLLYKRLGARTGAQAVAIAISLGLLRPTRPLPLPGQTDGVTP
ncbi:response regulator transcription factor [Streptomyces sp. NPDC059783]|uniref:response regulator transcription factor n=1 Tax=Streptomyces sp. NPDC059783 TaxID=3346944 RepID=UPI00364FC0BD